MQRTDSFYLNLLQEFIDENLAVEGNLENNEAISTANLQENTNKEIIENLNTLNISDIREK